MPSPGSVSIVVVGLLATGCSALGGDRLGAGPFMVSPEADAISYLAVRDEALDAEVLWTAVHPDIRAATSRAEFVACEYARLGVDGPTAPVSEQERPLEHPGEPRVGDVAMNGAEVRSTNVLERNGVRYSVADRRDDRGVVSVDVRVESELGSAVTTVQLAYGQDDPHWADPRYAPDGSPFAAGFPVVGTVPDDPCLVGAGAVRERLQTTGTISIGGSLDEPLAAPDGYRVLAVVRDGNPDGADVVGGAFWWVGEGPSDLEGVHPLRSGSAGDADAEAVPSDREEPPAHAPDWIDQSYGASDIVRLEPRTYTIDVWAHHDGLARSDRPFLPSDTTERRCALDVEVIAGPRTIIRLGEIPADGGPCPHEIERQYGF